MNPFSQLPSVKKDSKNGAARNFFAPSYFDPALVIIPPLLFSSIEEKRVMVRGQGHKSWVSVVAFDPYNMSYGELPDGLDFSGSDEEGPPPAPNTNQVGFLRIFRFRSHTVILPD